MSIMKGVKPLAVALSIIACLSPPSVSLDADQQTKEAVMREDIPWIIFLDGTVMDNYLNYATCPFANPTRVRVTYYVRRPDFQSDKMYEDLWLKNGRAIGLHRYSPSMPLKYDGLIYVRPPQRAMPPASDLTDAIVRVFLDASILNAVLRGISVPREIFDDVANQLPLFNFQSAKTAGRGRKLALHLMSDPPDMQCDKYFFYQNPY
jgi:hypothetical protein